MTEYSEAYVHGLKATANTLQSKVEALTSDLARSQDECRRLRSEDEDTGELRTRVGVLEGALRSADAILMKYPNAPLDADHDAIVVMRRALAGSPAPSVEPAHRQAYSDLADLQERTRCERDGLQAERDELRRKLAELTADRDSWQQQCLDARETYGGKLAEVERERDAVTKNRDDWSRAAGIWERNRNEWCERAEAAERRLAAAVEALRKAARHHLQAQLHEIIGEALRAAEAPAKPPCKHGVRTCRMVCDACGHFDTSEDDDSDYPDDAPAPAEEAAACTECGAPASAHGYGPGDGGGCPGPREAPEPADAKVELIATVDGKPAVVRITRQKVHDTFGWQPSQAPEPADESRFWQHAREAQTEVDTWPRWKRDAAARARVAEPAAGRCPMPDSCSRYGGCMGDCNAAGRDESVPPPGWHTVQFHLCGRQVWDAYHGGWHGQPLATEREAIQATWLFVDAIVREHGYAPAAPRTMWAEDSRGAWWRVEMRNGEPHMSYHPNWGYQPAFRDSFRRWHVEGESAPLGEPTAPRLDRFRALAERWTRPGCYASERMCARELLALVEEVERG